MRLNHLRLDDANTRAVLEDHTSVVTWSIGGPPTVALGSSLD